MSAAPTPRLHEVLDMMETALKNNSGEARRRVQFKNTMLSLVGVARLAAKEQFREARYAPPTPTESVLMHIRRRGTGS
jgi:hypothetical protein